MPTRRSRRKSSGGTSDPYAVFRSRRGRAVALGAAATSVLVFTGVAIVVPGPEPGAVGWRPVDRVLVVLLGLAIAGLLWRYATIRAVPTRQGLTVRNLILTRTVEWPEVLRVGFSGGAPWVSLELADTEQLAVMAIQRADGAFGRAEASRLSALVEYHSSTPEQ